MVPEAEETQVLCCSQPLQFRGIKYAVAIRRLHKLSHCLSDTPAVHSKGPVRVSIMSTEFVVALQLESATLGVPSSVDPAEDHAVSASLHPINTP